MKNAVTIIVLISMVFFIPVAIADREPNDNYHQAEHIGPGKYPGQVDNYYIEDLDYFKIEVPSLHYLCLRIESPDYPWVSLIVTLYNEDREYEDDYHLLGGEGEIVFGSWKNWLSVDMDLLIEVGSFFENEYLITYKISEEHLDHIDENREITDENEPNDSFETAQKAYQLTYLGELESTHILDNDVYSIEVPSQQTLVSEIHYLDEEEWDIGSIFYFDEVYELTRRLDEENYYYADFLNYEMFNNYTKKLIYKNEEETTKEIFILIEGNGKYEMEVDVEEEESFDLYGKILVYTIFGGAGILVMILIITMVIISIRRKKKERHQYDQYYNQYPGPSEEQVNNQLVSPQNHYIEKMTAMVVEEIEEIQVK